MIRCLRPRRPRRWLRNASEEGFSLVEVLLAIGVLAFAILAFLGLMGPLLRDLSDSREAAVVDAVLALASALAQEEAVAWRESVATGDPILRYIVFPPAGGEREPGPAGILIFDEQALRGEAGAGALPAGRLVELRGHTASAGFGAEIAYHILLFDARILPAPASGEAIEGYLGRFRTLVPDFSFPLVLRL